MPSDGSSGCDITGPHCFSLVRFVHIEFYWYIKRSIARALGCTLVGTRGISGTGGVF